MATNDIAIKVENVSKTFKLPHEKQTSLKGAFLSKLRSGRGYETQEALKDISFEVKKGEFFGIVGRNGSGKSTLLKCIAGVYAPNKGKIHINGTLVPFIELGVGFNPELSGRDNVFLNGALLGFSRKQMEKMYDEIVEFAELEQFMDQKLKNYSSGMQVRLAFSIAIRAKGDILLLDEVLAVGDSAFQRKCYDYFASLKREKRTIILVSHSMPTIEKYCHRAMLIEKSQIVSIGSSPKVAGMYEDMLLKEEAEKGSSDEGGVSKSPLQVRMEIVQEGKATRTIEAFKDLKFFIYAKANEDLNDVYLGINLKNSEKNVVFATEAIDHVGKLNFKKGQEMKITIDIDNIFTNGTYYFSLTASSSDNGQDRLLLKQRGTPSFTVFGIRRNPESLVHPRHTLTVEAK